MSEHTATYAVTGLTCHHCVHAVSGEVGELPGVTNVSVDLVPGGVSQLTVISSAPVTPEQLSAALAEAGDYHVESS